jgi:adenylylsulfate kinase
MRILIMGLPGSGKTTLAKDLQIKLSAAWFNADEIRKKYNDWDFNVCGRIRQSFRMRELCDLSDKKYNIADFVCPLPEMRDNFDADYTIWMDTIPAGRFEDTNKLFVFPEKYDIRITEMNSKKWAKFIGERILSNLEK